MKTELFAKVKIGNHSSVEELINDWKSRSFNGKEKISWFWLTYWVFNDRWCPAEREFDSIDLSESEKEIELFSAKGQDIILDYERRTGISFKDSKVSTGEIKRFICEAGYRPCNTEIILNYLFSNFDKKSLNWYDFVCDGPILLSIRTGKDPFSLWKKHSKTVGLSKRWVFAK